MEDEARVGLPNDALDWTDREVAAWARALGCDAAAEALLAHGVNGECLVEHGPDVFRAVGVCTVGHLFRLERARAGLIVGSDDDAARGSSARRWSVGRRARLPAPRRSARRSSSDSDDESAAEEDHFGIIKGMKSASRKLLATALFAGSMRRTPRNSVAASDAPRTTAESRRAGDGSSSATVHLHSRDARDVSNLTDDAASNRVKQGKSMAAVVVVVEAIVSISGTLSLWPHLVALLPGTLAVTSYVTGVLRTCVVAAAAGVAITTAEGDLRGA